MICKGNQKNSRSPSSYRPISLANSIHKVYACMLQQGLAHSIDHLLHPNQYGFQARGSISTPLFLLRRLTEIFARHSTSLYILFLGPRPLTPSAIHICHHLSADRAAIMALYKNPSSYPSSSHFARVNYHVQSFLFSSYNLIPLS